MKRELKQHLPIAEAITKLLYPFAEVVLHDIKKDTIEAIFNPISKRLVGDTSYLETLVANKTNQRSTFIGPYEKTNYDGRKLKSISIMIYNDKEIAIGFLCINLDISIFDKYKNILDLFLSPPSSKVNPEELFKNDLYEQINHFIQNHCTKNHLQLESLNRDQKKDIVLQLKKNGALEKINAPQYIARILNISRATIYNYLK